MGRSRRCRVHGEAVGPFGCKEKRMARVVLACQRKGMLQDILLQLLSAYVYLIDVSLTSEFFLLFIQ